MHCSLLPAADHHTSHRTLPLRQQPRILFWILRAALKLALELALNPSWILAWVQVEQGRSRARDGALAAAQEGEQEWREEAARAVRERHILVRELEHEVRLDLKLRVSSPDALCVVYLSRTTASARTCLRYCTQLV